jgi:hypothetical protein
MQISTRRLNVDSGLIGKFNKILDSQGLTCQTNGIQLQSGGDTYAQKRKKAER